MKRILITGKNSYIGKSFQAWLAQYPGEYEVDSISVRGDEWKDKDFSKYDSILHLAGIAHVSRNPKMEDLYYRVNRDLTISVAKKAKKENVKQFIFMSSIIVYGDSYYENAAISSDTELSPSNFYGKSKLEAERELGKLSTDTFRVMIIRPPMVYGKGAKGNFGRLIKIASRTPIFPEIRNLRSVINVDNLCEFIKTSIDLELRGVEHPQDNRKLSTTEMVKIISGSKGKKIYFTKILNPIIKLFKSVPIMKKIFGNLYYSDELSTIPKSYNLKKFEDAID